MTVRATITGLGEARAALRRSHAVAARAVPAAVSKAGALGLTQVRALASTGNHRPGAPHIPGTGPGPNVATGDYRREMYAEDHAEAGVAVSTVSTEAVQAARLEYGFIGVDSAGRHYRQSPFPHWGPAADLMEVRAVPFIAAAAVEIEAAMLG